jgi:peptide/nickel transport system substrate-binding protein
MMVQLSGGRRSRSPRRIPAMIALIGVGMTCACSGGAKERPSDQSSVLTAAIAADAESFDPATAVSDAWIILNTTYETLVGYSDDFKPTPRLATSWKQLSPTSYEFVIRKGVRFSNGRELTVDDVVGSLRRLVDPKTGSFWPGLLGPVTGVKAVGSDKVRVTLAAPRVSFISALANVPAVILPMKELKNGTFDPNKQILGTGPYQVRSHTAKQSWNLIRNPHYWGRPSGYKTLVFKILSDDNARMAAVRSGTTQIALFDSPDTARLLGGQASIKTVLQRTTGFYELQVNAVTSIFKDDRLRKALSLAIDRKQIVNVALSGVGTPTAAITPIGLPGSCDPVSIPYSTPDLNRARTLVAEAGAKGKSVSIIASTPVHSAIAQVLQQSLSAIGFAAKVETIERAQEIDRVYSSKSKVDFDLALNWYAGYNDPSMVTTWWNPALAVFNAAWMKSDGDVNRLIGEGFKTQNGPARQAVLQQLCDRAAEKANMIPLATRSNVVAYRSDSVEVKIPPVDALAQPLINIAYFKGR